MEPRADAQYEVGLGRDLRRGVVAVQAGATHRQRVGRPVAQRAAARMGLAHRDAERSGELGKLVPGLGVVHTAAGDDVRALRGAQHLDRFADALLVRRTPLDPPHVWFEE